MSYDSDTTTITVPGVVVVIVIIWVCCCWRRGTCCFSRPIPTAVALPTVAMQPSVTVIQHAPSPPPPPQPSPAQTNNYFIMPGGQPQMQPQTQMANQHMMEQPPPYMPNQPQYMAGQPTYPPQANYSPHANYSPQANYSPHQPQVPPYMVEKNVQSAPPQQPMFNPVYHASAPKL